MTTHSRWMAQRALRTAKGSLARQATQLQRWRRFWSSYRRYSEMPGSAASVDFLFQPQDEIGASAEVMTLPVDLAAALELIDDSVGEPLGDPLSLPELSQLALVDHVPPLRHPLLAK